jgi:molybdopterin converting factor subunit 1
MKVTIRYFAVLREHRGLGRENVVTASATPGALYAELQKRHGLALPPERLRVAVNQDFAAWDTLLREGDEVAFIPPVAGG